MTRKEAARDVLENLHTYSFEYGMSEAEEKDLYDRAMMVLEGK